jgi:hypothetical protein
MEAPLPTAVTPGAITDGWVVRVVATRVDSLVKTPASMTMQAFDDGFRVEEARFFLRDRCPVSTRWMLWAETVFVRVAGNSIVLTLFRSSCLLRET